jgi:hypothetical protein
MFETIEGKPTRCIQPWEKQTGETSRQFAVFTAYRNQNPLQRSLAKVAEQLGYSTVYVERLSSSKRWRERVEAFDAEQDRLDQQLRWRQIQEMRKRQSSLAAAALDKAREGLTYLDPKTMRASEIARLLDVAGRLERAARGVSDDVSEDETPLVFNADKVRAALRAEGLL